MTDAELIAELTTRIRRDTIELENARARQRIEESREFIRVNQITLADVQLSTGVGMPHFGSVDQFGTWLRGRPLRAPWCEWNGHVHHTSNVMSSVFKPTVALLNHVPPMREAEPESEAEPNLLPACKRLTAPRLPQVALELLQEACESTDPLDIVNAFVKCPGGDVPNLPEYWLYRLGCLAEYVAEANFARAAKAKRKRRT